VGRVGEVRTAGGLPPSPGVLASTAPSPPAEGGGIRVLQGVPWRCPHRAAAPVVWDATSPTRADRPVRPSPSGSVVGSPSAFQWSVVGSQPTCAGGRESNPRQPGEKPGALPAELPRPGPAPVPIPCTGHVPPTAKRRGERAAGLTGPAACFAKRRRWESNPLGPGCSRLPRRLAPASLEAMFPRVARRVHATEKERGINSHTSTPSRNVQNWLMAREQIAHAHRTLEVPGMFAPGADFAWILSGG
jgi:hypothetical protein